MPAYWDNNLEKKNTKLKEKKTISFYFVSIKTVMITMLLAEQ